MRPISSIKYVSVIFLLEKGYSLYQIEFKTGIERSTIENIKEMGSNKKNNKGEHLIKLIPYNKQTLIYFRKYKYTQREQFAVYC